jgi:hypothetical protein
MANPLIGEAPPAGDAPGGEFEVIGVERLGWFSADVVIAARHAFTRRRDALTRHFYRITPYEPFASEIAIRAGETFHLLLPRRLARQGQRIDFDEMADNPAFEARWRGVEGE